MATSGKRTPLGWLCTVAGTLILVATLAAAALMALPPAIGWEQRTVLTGSMEPEIPVGSMIYVAPADPAELAEGDVVTFENESGDIVTHRVESNRAVEGELITKGDANEGEDLAPVPYSAVRGKVVLAVPYLGDVLGALASPVGKVYLLAFGACANQRGPNERNNPLWRDETRGNRQWLRNRKRSFAN